MRNLLDRCEKQGLNKGKWMAEEDDKLTKYIEKHGLDGWRPLPAKAGLNRCGKSCRLRWTNYLRPDINRGNFTLLEERTIIQLHAFLGNGWSAISAYLPMRTDNDIKNFWYTTVKKKLIKMGIDPETHKPKTNLFAGAGAGSEQRLTDTISHKAQWECARLEAESRLAFEARVAMTSSRPVSPTWRSANSTRVLNSGTGASTTSFSDHVLGGAAATEAISVNSLAATVLAGDIILNIATDDQFAINCLMVTTYKLQHN